MRNTENTELNSVKNRLIHFINSKGLSQSKFEKLVGLSNGYVNNIVNTISDKTFDYKISVSFPELSKIWILHGKGPMEISFNEPIEEKPHSLINIKNLPHAEQMEILLKKILDIEEEQKKTKEDLRISQIINRGLLKNIVKHLKIKPEEIERERLNEELLDHNKTTTN